MEKDFKTKIEELSEKSRQGKKEITSEGDTKLHLVSPFIAILGYEKIEEVRSEYKAGRGDRDEKVDYAIFREKELIFIIEVESISESLENNYHLAQLENYFNHTKEVKFAILTNGIQYRFYSDLDNQNLMDKKPFLVLDLLDLKETAIRELEKFSRSKFDFETLYSNAKKLMYINKIQNFFEEERKNLNEDFLQFLYQKTSQQNQETIPEEFPKAVQSVFSSLFQKGSKKKETSSLSFSQNFSNTSEEEKIVWFCRRRKKKGEVDSKAVIKKIHRSDRKLKVEMTLLKGSKVAIDDKSYPEKKKRKREEILSKKSRKEEEKYYELTEDIDGCELVEKNGNKKFLDPSGMALFCLGRATCNGNEEWKNKQGKTLGKFLEEEKRLK